MGNSIIAFVSLLPFITLIFSYLYYTDQAMNNIKKSLENNIEKRNNVVLELHRSSYDNLREAMNLINTEVLISGGHKVIKPKRIRDIRDKVLEVFYLLDDANDIKESYHLASKALSNARIYGLILIIVIAFTIFSIGFTSGILMDEVIAVWFVILSFMLPYTGIKLGKSLKIYKVIGHLLSKHEVGIHDESK